MLIFLCLFTDIFVNASMSYNIVSEIFLWVYGFLVVNSSLFLNDENSEVAKRGQTTATVTIIEFYILIKF